jgi:uroporphyrinogen decarboxylase
MGGKVGADCARYGRLIFPRVGHLVDNLPAIVYILNTYSNGFIVGSRQYLSLLAICNPGANYMNPRERFQRITNHQEADRVPIDMGSHVASLHVNSYERLRAHLTDLALPAKPRILDRHVQNVVPEEALLQRYGVDFRWIAPNWVDVVEVDAETYRDMWGIEWRYLQDAYHNVVAPLATATTTDLDRYPWPDPYNAAMFTGLAERARHLYENTGYVIAADAIKGGLLTTALQIRGYEQFFMDTVLDEAFVNALLDKLLWLYKEMWTSYLKVVGPYVQLVYFTDDIGAQKQMLISPDMFRNLLKPRLKALIDHIKGLADVKFMYHTDGTVNPVIDDIIDMGVDILNPIQTSALGMDTAALKEMYRGRLCFHGAIDVQQMLPSSTPDEVQADVIKRVQDLGRGGGYILAPCHNLGSDIPPENIETMFAAVQEHGQYPL